MGTLRAHVALSFKHKKEKREMLIGTHLVWLGYKSCRPKVKANRCDGAYPYIFVPHAESICKTSAI